MKHLIQYRLFESNQDIESICEKYGIQNFTINSDGSIDVNGDVDLSYKELDKLSIKFRNVTGNFNCYYNNLTSLEGSPKSVGGHFICSLNNLTLLEGGPKSVGGDFDCSYNNLTSVEGAPESVSGLFNCQYNPVYQIWNLFRDKDKIELFNDMDIIQGDSIILDRLIYFLDEIGNPKSEEELRGLIKDYRFII
jgi:hypothetical protein